MYNILPLTELFFDRKQAILLPIQRSEVLSTWGSNKEMVATMAINLESYGFQMSLPLTQAMSHLTDEMISDIYRSLIKPIKKSVGSHVAYAPMYPNFPKQVMKASDFDLWQNAMLHYFGSWIGHRILPSFVAKERKELTQKTKPRVLNIAVAEDIADLVKQMMESRVGPSDSEKEAIGAFVSWMFDTLTEDERILWIQTADIQNREVLAIWQAEWVCNLGNLMDFQKHWNSTTDMLRLAYAWNGGDVSLSEKTKFKSFPRKLRKNMLGAMQKVLSDKAHGESLDSQDLENLYARRESWLRLGEALHPGEYVVQFPRAFQAFQTLRNQRNFKESYAASLEAALRSNSGNWIAAGNILSQRPGVFARRWIQWMGQMPEAFHENGVNDLAAVLNKVSSPVLLQLHSRLSDDANASRVFSPKGCVASLFVSNGKESILSNEIRLSMMEKIEQELVRRWSELEPLGKVYVDDDMAYQPIPFGVRSASKALHTIVRGARMPLDKDTNIMRFFMWWNENGQDKNGNDVNTGRIDLDLSCMLMDQEFNVIRWCSWTDIRSEGMTHSGDITSAPNGASEFIDVDFRKLSDNVSYIVMVVNSFTSQPFSDMPEAFAGWMEREKAQRGEIFDARTVSQKFDLTAQAQAVCPMIVDVKNRSVVWADMPFRSANFWHMVERQRKVIAWTVKGMTSWNRPKLSTLFNLHVKARGQLVETVEEADVVISSVSRFELKEGQKQILATDQDLIVSDFLS